MPRAEDARKKARMFGALSARSNIARNDMAFISGSKRIWMAFKSGNSVGYIGLKSPSMISTDRYIAFKSQFRTFDCRLYRVQIERATFIAH